MFDGFSTFSVVTQDEPNVTIAGVQHPPKPDASLPALLLIHGFPQTHHIWHRVAPELVAKYNVIIPDIRGYGASSKPPNISSYSKTKMAKDMAVLMEKLGFKSFYVCGHDRGARVAHKLAVDWPDRVQKMILLDICPTLAMYEGTNFSFAKAYFHWFFLIQDAPLPETLISSTPRHFAELYMGGRSGHRLDIFDAACFEEYAALFEDEATVHAMCNDYRAAASFDMDEQKADLAAGRLIRCPVRAIWGGKGVVAKNFDAVKEWQAVSHNAALVEGYSADCGHYIPEEKPNDVVKAILEFCA